jgi:hypothetical protein
VYRIVTFVPTDKLEEVLEGVLRVVPLQYGHYDRAVWWTEQAVEQFRPLPGANPTVGRENEISRVPSVRVELAIPRDATLLHRFLTEGLIPAHPWEEPAIFIDECEVTVSRPG